MRGLRMGSEQERDSAGREPVLNDGLWKSTRCCRRTGLRRPGIGASAKDGHLARRLRRPPHFCFGLIEYESRSVGEAATRATKEEPLADRPLALR
jgi:hypothetical protein